MGVGAGLYMYVVVVQKFTFAISSPDEFLFNVATVNIFSSVDQDNAKFTGRIQNISVIVRNG